MIERALAKWASKHPCNEIAGQYLDLRHRCGPMVDTYDRQAIIAALARELEPTGPARSLLTWWTSVDAFTGALIGPSGIGKTLAAIRLAVHTPASRWRVAAAIERDEVDALIRDFGLLVIDEAAGPNADHTYVRGLIARIVTHRHDAGRRTLLVGNVSALDLLVWLDGAQGSGRLETRLGPHGVIDCSKMPVVRGKLKAQGGVKTQLALKFLELRHALQLCAHSRTNGWTPRANMIAAEIGLSQTEREKIDTIAAEFAEADAQVEEALASLKMSLTTWSDEA